MSDGGQTIRITRRALLAALKEQPGVVQREFEAARKEGAVLDHGPNGFWWWKDVGGNAGKPLVERVEALERDGKERLRMQFELERDNVSYGERLAALENSPAPTSGVPALTYAFVDLRREVQRDISALLEVLGAVSAEVDKLAQKHV